MMKKSVLFFLFFLSAISLRCQERCFEIDNFGLHSPQIDKLNRILFPGAKGLIRCNDQGCENIPFSKDPLLNNNLVSAIQVLDSQEILVASRQGAYLSHITQDGTLIFPDTSRGQNDYFNEIMDIHIVGDTALFAVQEGVVLYSLSSHEIIKLVQPSDYFKLYTHTSKNPNLTRKFVPDVQNADLLWICSINGLYGYYVKKDSLIHYPFDPSILYEVDYLNGQSETINLHNVVQYNGNFYFTSWGGGIIKYDRTDEKWIKFLYEEDIPLNAFGENNTQQLDFLNDSIVLVTVHRRSPLLFNLRTERYVDSNIINLELKNLSSSALMVQDKHFWISYSKSICVYLKKNENFEINDPRIFLDKIDVTKTGHTDPIIHPWNFKKKYSKDERSISFTLGTTGFYEKVPEIEYKLASLNNSWIPLRYPYKLQFAQLNGGNYQLEYRLKWNDQIIDGLPYIFSIEKYYWEKIIFWVLISLLILTIGLLVTYLLNRARKIRMNKELTHQKELMEVRLSALRTQMNPHFLFNSLTSINKFIMYENPQKASNYLANFSHLIRRILNNSKEDFITLEDEIKTLSLYTEMENVRFNDKFQMLFDFDPNLKLDRYFIPPMLIQPFIENAILHGLTHKKTSGTIKLELKLHDDDKLKIIVTDDGIGREAALKIKKKNSFRTKSLGLSVTKKRMAMIAQVYGMTPSILITDLTDSIGKGTGTRVEVVMPLINEENKKSFVQK